MFSMMCDVHTEQFITNMLTVYFQITAAELIFNTRLKIFCMYKLFKYTFVFYIPASFVCLLERFILM